jgi:hypothetical protein
MQNRENSGYDETKRMLNTLRKLNESIKNSDILKEQESENTVSTDDNVDNINDVDVKLISSDKSDLELTDDQKNTISGLIDSFREQVSQIANLEPGLTFNMNQVRLDGTISDVDLSFVLIAGDDSGLFINADMLKVEDEVLSTIDKLSKFQLIFEDAMNPIIRQRNSNI